MFCEKKKTALFTSPIILLKGREGSKVVSKGNIVVVAVKFNANISENRRIFTSFARELQKLS